MPNFKRLFPPLEHYFFSGKLVSVYKTKNNRIFQKQKFIYWAEIKDGKTARKIRISKEDFEKIKNYKGALVRENKSEKK